MMKKLKNASFKTMDDLCRFVTLNVITDIQQILLDSERMYKFMLFYWEG